ncbi:MAG: globin domain-containing protein [Candidatus Thiodiazotropha lotti]|uniref:Hemin receptor n=1 Tax=Candidatus Thiodiazotropha endoloripes TaxID=1818881 RepID=A0A1E2UPJ5_9GAMM|nr:globin family protein [Candidatus Thiodiazotropha endoloripes]MCG7897123.1 globin domain-containing protein [Candidatus Thiodiazotropha weberae]MCG7993610.1 globin domain-containing protein [Candidatus Thiodiazotropha lotti]MCG7903859.1 globin domain-containing protein [Candidatus Thiodiazotropha weberae]MCG7914506.1 globin domain-containing protein [Candidatus Thiodiazotropha weberae]MCG8001236.1 globin domain-containing protein [Candidatus Thiodiazotropha lotti]
MTPEQITHVKSSWSKVEPIADQAAALFYGRLFEVYPEVKPYFKGDMEAQGKKLMSMIGTAVGSLDNLEPLLPVIRESGKRHAEYGVQAVDYDKVADALLWTLGEGLGDAFTDEVKEAWVVTYTALAGVMKEGAEETA